MDPHDGCRRNRGLGFRDLPPSEERAERKVPGGPRGRRVLQRRDRVGERSIKRRATRSVIPGVGITGRGGRPPWEKNEKQPQRRRERRVTQRWDRGSASLCALCGSAVALRSSE